ncbi:MAG: sigma-70 family RNA polymerase sigma factor [Verrucomicrobia bacterium]|jgi:RNA polymerase sigma-70 factor (ECF subfamily)|nr:sigma-70 family RNA polymerase sigma factor [Verrucomicrobiota bacterium]
MPTTEQDAHDCADMERLVAGHDASLNDLMSRHAESVFRFLSRMLGNEEDAQDLAQETFVRVYRARESFHPDRKFTTWLYTIAANLARNHLRWRARHPAVSLETSARDGDPTVGQGLVATGNTPETELAFQERLATVRQAVGQLPEDLREALVLCEWEELSMVEAAEILHTTPKAVDSRLYRARRQLRERLAPLLQD